MKDNVAQLLEQFACVSVPTGLVRLKDVTLLTIPVSDTVRRAHVYRQFQTRIKRIIVTQKMGEAIAESTVAFRPT